MSSPRILLSVTLAVVAVLIVTPFFLSSPESRPAHPADPPAKSATAARENRPPPPLTPAEQPELSMSPLEAEASAQRAADAAERAAERATDRGTDQ
jgi:hypothetical protein